jgi:hypothetical protein
MYQGTRTIHVMGPKTTKHDAEEKQNEIVIGLIACWY